MSTTAVISTATPGVASPMAFGSQVCSGHSGAFTAKANMKPRNRAFSATGEKCSFPEARAWVMVVRSKVPWPSLPMPCRAVITYRPITAASMIRPPSRLYSRNLTAA